MTLNTSSNLGLGTATISTGYSGGSGSMTFKNAKSIAFNNASDTWSTSTTGGAITYFTDNALYIDAKDSTSLIYFRVNNATNRMIIDGSGNVTIGPTSFSASKFQVTGSVAIGYTTSTAAPTNG